MTLLQNITLSLPIDDQLSGGLFSLLSGCGTIKDRTFAVRATNPDYLPTQVIEFSDVVEPAISFNLTEDRLSWRIANETGEQKASPHSYALLDIAEITHRLDGLGKILMIDHLGVNFPWSDGVSPILKSIRSKLKDASAYYLFPEGQPWDFILPATKEEIQSGDIDLRQERRPKFELVSFEKTSKPLIQIDCITTASYAELTDAFPEGITSDELRNIWVYIQTAMDIDLCLVLNEKTNQDWSNFFDGYRLKQ